MKLTHAITMALVSLFFALTPESAHAFGKKRKDPPQAVDTQAYPTRIVSYGRFLKTQFTLPNKENTLVDMNTVLNQLVATEMGQATNKLRFSGRSANGDMEPEDRFILRGGLVSFEANNFQAGIKFGYKNGADVGNGFKVDGQLDFTVGSLEFEFEIIDKERGQQVAVGKGSALTPGVDLKVTLSVSDFNTAPEFIYKSPMAKVFQKAIRNAILSMANSSKTNFLMDWTARVSKVDVKNHRVFFDNGARDDIKNNDVFSVYDGEGMLVGEIKVNQAQHEQSAASYKDDGSDAKLKNTNFGDKVKIHYLNR